MTPCSTSRRTGTAGLRPTGRATLAARDVVESVQAEVLPYDKNYLRHGDRLRPALDALDGTWTELRRSLSGGYRAREAAAMAAHARWMYRAALARTESRGMHKRHDFPSQDPAQHHRLITSGLDDVRVAPE